MVGIRQSTAGLGRDFGKLWTASTLSGLGDGATQVAGGLLAVTLTSDPVLVSGLLIAQTLPWMVLALPSGVLVDRLDRRRLMVGASVIRACALGLLGLAVVGGEATLSLLYAVFFLVGCAGLIFENASTTSLPSLVRHDLLEQANGRLQASKAVSEQLVAKPLGGVLFTLAAWAPFLVDAAALVVIAVLTAMLPRTLSRAASGPRLTIRASIAEGARWLMGHRLLRTLTLTVGLSNVGLGAVFSLLVLVARDRLGVGSLGYGLLLAVAALGGVLGGLFAGRIVTAIGPGAALRAGLVVETLSYLGLAVTDHVLPAALVLVLFSMHLSIFSTIGASLRQSLVPPELLGRVHSAYRLVSTAGMLLGAALGGALSRQFGLTAPFWLGLACTVFFTLLVWRTLNNPDILAARRTAARQAAGEHP